MLEFTAATVINTKTTVVTAGASGTKVGSLTATSTDSSDRVVQVWLTRSAASYLLTSGLVPANAGSDGIVFPFDLLNTWTGLPFDINGLPYLLLESGDTLQVSIPVALTAAKKLDLASVGANF